MLVAVEPSFAERLRELRQVARITASELARRSGLTRQAISSLEKGDNAPSWDTVKKLARGLGVSVAAFDAPNDEANPPAPDSDIHAPRPRSAGKRK